MKAIAVIMAFCATGRAMGVLPVCVSNPIELEAGLSLFSVSINTPLTRRCEASVIFDNSDFLPVSYLFPVECVGSFRASFAIPHGAPTGGAYISWQCSGQSPMCNRVHITGGQADPNLPLQQVGQVSCLSQPQPTSFMTTTRATPGAVEKDKTNTARGTQTAVDGSVPLTTGLPTAGTATSPPTTTRTRAGPSTTTTAMATGPLTTVTHRPTEGITGGVTGETTANPLPTGDTTNGATTRTADITTTMITTIILTQTITSLATAPCMSK